MIRRPPRSTLFPTRRSSDLHGDREQLVCLDDHGQHRHPPPEWRHLPDAGVHDRGQHHQSQRPVHLAARSEEHTSELQSQSNLVCRLLLEKKKKKNKTKKTLYKEDAERALAKRELCRGTEVARSPATGVAVRSR